MSAADSGKFRYSSKAHLSMNVILFSDTRCGSSAISDLISRNLNLEDYGEIFHPITDKFSELDKLTNYHIWEKTNSGKIEDFYNYLEGLGKNFCAKIMYHDLSLKIKHPLRMDFRSPLISSFQNRPNFKIIHLRREKILLASISSILAISHGVHHSIKPLLNVQKKIYIDIGDLKREADSRQRAHMYAQAVIHHSNLQKSEIIYENIFTEAGHNYSSLETIFDVNFTSSTRYTKLLSHPENFIENWYEIKTFFSI